MDAIRTKQQKGSWETHTALTQQEDDMINETMRNTNTAISSYIIQNKQTQTHTNIALTCPASAWKTFRLIWISMVLEGAFITYGTHGKAQKLAKKMTRGGCHQTEQGELKQKGGKVKMKTKAEYYSSSSTFTTSPWWQQQSKSLESLTVFARVRKSEDHTKSTTKTNGQKERERERDRERQRET